MTPDEKRVIDDAVAAFEESLEIRSRQLRQSLVDEMLRLYSDGTPPRHPYFLSKMYSATGRFSTEISESAEFQASASTRYFLHNFTSCRSR